MIKIAYIRKLPNGKFRVYSRKGRNLGTYNSRAGAKKRLRQVEFFKRKKALSYFVELIKIADETVETYSSTIRKLKKEEPEKVIPFMKYFKEAFDQGISEGIEEPEHPALLEALQKIK